MTNAEAISLLRGLEKSLDGYCELNDDGKKAFNMAVSALELFGNSEQLPSAQPEIIHCRDCKHHWTFRPMGNMPTETCVLEQTFYDANVDFCSLAERRTDE